MITIIIIMKMLKMITNVITNLGSRAFWRPASTGLHSINSIQTQKIFFNAKYFHENPYKFKSTAKLFIQTFKNPFSCKEMLCNCKQSIQPQLVPIEQQFHPLKFSFIQFSKVLCIIFLYWLSLAKYLNNRNALKQGILSAQYQLWSANTFFPLKYTWLLCIQCSSHRSW